MMPGTPDQSSLVVIRPVLLQSWLKGKAWAELSARTAATPRAKAAAKAGMRSTNFPRSEEILVRMVYPPFQAEDCAAPCHDLAGAAMSGSLPNLQCLSIGPFWSYFRPWSQPAAPRRA